MPKVKFINEKKEIEVPEGANLRKEARRQGIEVYRGVAKVLHCPGLGLCTTCKVVIRKGKENVSPLSRWERLNMAKEPLTYFTKLSYENDEEAEVRLSCQTQVYGDIEVETHPKLNLHGEKFWA